MTYGPSIIARTISSASIKDKFGNSWQYHSRSDHHSKVACWAILFDLIQSCPLLASHITAGKVGFGINHEMNDFKVARKKNLDLVICRVDSHSGSSHLRSFTDLATEYGIKLTKEESAILSGMPELHEAKVKSVLAALEAKACMTAHNRARPRLYDELTSSHITVHGDTSAAIAIGFVMINISNEFISSTQAENKKSLEGAEPLVNYEAQPKSTIEVIDKLKQLPRSTKDGEVGFDALGIIIVDCKNDGSEVAVVNVLEDGKNPVDKIYKYDTMIDRISHIYSTRFKEI